MPMNSTAAKTKKSATASLWINTKISTWWQRNKLSAASSKRTTAATTQKWRNLSPDEPPLPFLSSSLNHSTTKSNNVVARGITLKSSGTRQDCSEQKMIAPTVLPEKLIFNNQVHRIWCCNTQMILNCRTKNSPFSYIYISSSSNNKKNSCFLHLFIYLIIIVWKALPEDYIQYLNHLN